MKRLLVCAFLLLCVDLNAEIVLNATSPSHYERISSKKTTLCVTAVSAAGPLRWNWTATENNGVTIRVGGQCDMTILQDPDYDGWLGNSYATPTEKITTSIVFDENLSYYCNRWELEPTYGFTRDFNLTILGSDSDGNLICTYNVSVHQSAPVLAFFHPQGGKFVSVPSSYTESQIFENNLHKLVNPFHRGDKLVALPIAEKSYTFSGGEIGKYRFVKWSTSGGQRISADTIIYDDETIYANWGGLYEIVRENEKWQVQEGANANGVPHLEILSGPTTNNLCIPESLCDLPVGAICSHSFENTGIVSLELPDTLCALGDYAFAQNEFTSITVPSNILTIGDYAFSSCKQLARVVLRGDVTNIGSHAFLNCSSLKKFYMAGMAPNLNCYLPSDCDVFASSYYDPSKAGQIVSMTNGVPCKYVAILTNLSEGELAFEAATNLHVKVDGDCEAYFTMDETIPSIATPMEADDIQITMPCVVHIMAIISESPMTKVYTFRFVDDGKIPPPTYDSISGTAFYHSNTVFTLSCSDKSFVIKYTLDGREPNWNSATYQQGLVLSEDSFVRARCYSKDGLSRSKVVDAHYFREWEQCEYPNTDFEIRVSCDSVVTNILLSCATKDAEIIYTLDGSDPRTSVAARSYQAAIRYQDGFSLKVYAHKNDWRDSEITDVIIDQDWFPCPEYTLTFEPEGGECDIESLVLGRKWIVEDFPIPVKKDCVFMGWVLPDESSQRVSPPFSIDADTTLYAKWGILGPAVVNGCTWQYQTNDDLSAVSLVGVETYQLSSVKIPAEINGWKVNKIGEGLLGGRSGVVSIVIENGIEEIGGNAFQGTSLEKIVIPPSVTNFSGFAAIWGGAPYVAWTLSGAPISSAHYALKSSSPMRTMITAEAGIPEGFKTIQASMRTPYFRCKKAYYDEWVGEYGEDHFLGYIPDNYVYQSDDLHFVDIDAAGGDFGVSSDEVDDFFAIYDEIGSASLINYGSKYAFSCEKLYKPLSRYYSNKAVFDKLIPQPRRAGYAFEYWRDGDYTVETNGNMYVCGDSLVAQWRGIQYVIVFDKNGIPDATHDTVKWTKRYGKEISMPECAYSSSGYHFAGWSYTPSVEDDFVPLTVVSNLTTTAWESITIYAQWSYDVAFDSNGGEADPDARIYRHGQCVGSLDAPIRDGYTFSGWFSEREGGDKIDASYRVTKPITLFAHWEQKDLIDSYAWSYTYDEAGAIIIDSVSPLQSGVVVVPDKILGKDVVELRGVGSASDEGIFEGADQITSIVLPATIRKIGTRAFRGCSRLTSIEIPSGVTDIGTWAFEGCSALRNIAIPNSVTNIGSYAFSGCSPVTVTIPARFDLAKVFSDCSNIATLSIADGATIVPDEYNADQNLLPNLQKIILPASILSVGRGAFRTTLAKEVNFGTCITNIEGWAFADCPEIMNIALPHSLQKMGTTTFANCSKLTAITFPNGNDVFESFNGAVYDKRSARLVRYPAGADSFELKSGVISIGNYAAYGCGLFESVSIPESVRDIGSYAFWHCDGIFHFLGDRPTVSETNIWGSDEEAALLSVYFRSGTTGWIDGGRWCGAVTRKEANTGYQFTIVFDPGQGVGGGVYMVDEGSGLENMPSCSRDGYVFLGWYTSETEGVQVLTINNVSADAKYYAHWELSSDIGSASEGAYDYELADNGAVIVVGSKTSALTGDVTIPSTIDDHPVTAIAASAFVRNKNLTSIVLPESVKSIGDYAFFGCDALVSADLGAVTNIGVNAFASCYSLKNVDLPDCLESLGGGTFENCLALERIEIPAAVKSLENDFLGCESLRNVTLSKGLLEIGESAFEGCVSLSAIAIPASVEFIDGSAFAGCEKLLAIEVADGNRHYCSIDGMVLTKDKRVLVIAAGGCATFQIPSSVVDVGDHAFCGAVARSVSVPSSVTNIGAGAFFSCTNLTVVTMAEGVQKIGDEAFEGCIRLGALTLPTTLSYVGDNAFIENGLTNVTFLGNAPTVGTCIYACMDDNFCSYVTKGSTGWFDFGSETLPATWQGYPIQFYSTSNNSTSYGPYVPGEKVSVVVNELVGYTAKGLPTGLKLNKKTGEISGTPTKPTGDGGVTVTFTKRGADTLKLQFIVSPIPTIDVILAGDTEKCKVTGANKAYLVGKKVSLSVSSPKGTAFTGWYRDGEPWPSETDYLKTKLSYVMTRESLILTARFEKEKMSLACTELAGATFTVGVSLDAAGLPVEIQTQSGVKSVKATKLPTGMKLVQDKSTKTWSITGAPTKAGTYNVTLTVTAVSGATQSITIPVTVAALPSCLVGTYTGMVGRGKGENWRAYGTFSLTVSATGKLSSKVIVPGRSYSFSAARWDGCMNDAFVVEMKTKKGETLSVIVDGAKPWYEAKISDAEQGNVFSIPNIEPFQVVAWRNEFGKNGELVEDAVANDFVSKIIALKKIALRVTGSKSEGYDLAVLDSNDLTADLKITFDAKGNVKFVGKIDGTSISGKSLLRVDGSDYYTLFDLVLPIKKSEVMYFAFGFERGETDAPECDFEVKRYDYP